MLRYLYRAALRLHPAVFRRRFGDEMLSIFDQAQTYHGRLILLSDCLISILRQRIARPEFWAESSARPSVQAAYGVPSFSSLDVFRPRTSAVIDGLILSAALFLVTCFAIRYSWIRVLHLQIQEYQVEGYLGIHRASPTELLGNRGSDSQRSPATEAEPGLISARLQFDVMPVEAGPVRPSSPVLNSKVPAVTVEPQILGRPIKLRLPLESYAGTYQSRSPQLIIRISVKDEQVSMRIANEPSVMLSATSETTFVIDGSEDRSVEFLPDSTGKMQRLQLSRGSQTITAERR